jgi:putative CocE/NonD family hydrolase
VHGDFEGRTEETWLAMADGVRLSTSLVLPDGDGPWPVILEALPYRKDDLTVSYRGEYQRLADEGGFAVARVDVRGTGSSEGIAHDEYPPEEQSDLAEVIAWLADQTWSTGAVGMYGTSYSGFNALQLAARRPPALKAICAIYATDDCFTDDVHYVGGQLRALDLVDYPTYMIACNALPPVPAVYGEGWREEWRRRLDQTEPWVLRWLTEQVDSPYWRKGSLRGGTRPPESDNGYDRIEAATMIVAGWADGYRNNTFRTFERLTCPKRLLAGPWSHMSTASSLPGPHLDLVPELVAWFGHHLRGDDNGVDTAPPIQVYVRDAVEPEPDLAEHPGDWWALPSWPPPEHATASFRVDGAGALLLPDAHDVGESAWNSCAGSLPWGQPTDQVADEARSLLLRWPAPAQPIDVLGQPRLHLRARCDQPVVTLSAKLADGLPGGASHLITRGFLNLTHRGSSTEPTEVPFGEWLDLTIDLEATTWHFEPGHEVRLAVSRADWPNAWPAPTVGVIEVDQASIQLDLPIAERPDLPYPRFVDPPGEGDDHGPDLDDDVEQPPVRWWIEHDVLGRRRTARDEHGYRYSGRYGARIVDTFTGATDVSTVDPADAGAEGTYRCEITWPEATVSASTRLSVRSTAEEYQVEIDLDVTDGDELVARKRWHEVIPRHLQ